jgi:hypothetical protein
MNSRFVERAAKIRPLNYLPNFSFKKPEFFISWLTDFFKEQPLFVKAGCKDNPGFCLSKSFWKLIR